MPGTLVRSNPAKLGTIPNGDWQICVTDATSTASTSSELLNPGSSTKTVSQVVRIGPEARRVIIRARYETAITAATTSPVVRVFGIYATDAQLVAASGTTFPTDGSVRFKRLDNNSATASGITVTLTPATPGDLRDGTYKYSNPIQVSSSEFIDLANANALLVLVETAAASLTGGTLVQIECLLVD